MPINNGDQIEYAGRVLRVTGRTRNDMFVDEVEVIQDSGLVTTITLGLSQGDRRSAKVDATPDWLEKASEYERRRNAEKLAFRARGTGLTPEQFSDVQNTLVSDQISAARVAFILRDHKQGVLANRFIKSLADQILDWARKTPNSRKYKTPLSAKQLRYLA